MNELTIGEFPEKYTNAKCKTWEISKTHEVGIKIKNALDSGVFEAVAQAISEAFFRYAEIESIMGMVKREQDKSEKIGANKVRKAFHDLFEREY
jgi:valyl-tRNA synthetase